MGQSHGAEEGGEDQPVRRVQRVVVLAARQGRRPTGGSGAPSVVGLSLGHRGIRREPERRPGPDLVHPGVQQQAAVVVVPSVHGAGRHGPQRFLEPDADGGLDGDLGVPAEGRRLVQGVGGARVAVPGEHQEDRRHEQRGQFQAVLEGLDEGDAAHAAGRHGQGDDDSDEHTAEPARCAGDQAQGEARALELGQQVEPADADDEHAGDAPGGPRLQSRVGEVGQRVRPGAAQRSGDEHEQHEVAGCVAHGEPEHLDALGGDEPGDAEEGGRRQVLAADGHGVEVRRNGTGGDVEVGGGAGDAQPRRADHQGRDDRRRHGHDAVRLVHPAAPARPGRCRWAWVTVRPFRRGPRCPVRCVRRVRRTSGR